MWQRKKYHLQTSNPPIGDRGVLLIPYKVHGIDFYCYTDDMQLCISIPPKDVSPKCIDYINLLMSQKSCQLHTGKQKYFLRPRKRICPSRTFGIKQYSFWLLLESWWKHRNTTKITCARLQPFLLQADLNYFCTSSSPVDERERWETHISKNLQTKYCISFCLLFLQGLHYIAFAWFLLFF